MPFNLDKLGALSKHPNDKIVDEGEITIVNNGDTDDGDPNSGSYQTSKIVMETRDNNYEKASFIRARWSIDGGSNWYSLYDQIIYLFDMNVIFDDGTDTQPNWNLDSAISVGCNNSTIYFRTANGKHGDVELDLTTGGSGESYTPIPRTFIIQWWMYERE